MPELSEVCFRPGFWAAVPLQSNLVIAPQTVYEHREQKRFWSCLHLSLYFSNAHKFKISPTVHNNKKMRNDVKMLAL